MHPLHIVLILLEFQPRAPVGNDRGLVARSAVAVERLLAVHAGAAHKLADDDALRTVDDERTRFRHEREISHEHFLLHHLARLLVGEARLDAQRQRIGGVAVLALLDGVLGLAFEGVGKELQLQLAGEVDDGRIVLEDFSDAVVDEVLVGILLHLDEIRNVEHVLDPRKILALGGSVHDLVNSLGHVLLLEITDFVPRKKIFQKIRLSRKALVFFVALRYTNAVGYNPLPPKYGISRAGISIIAHFPILSAFCKTVNCLRAVIFGDPQFFLTPVRRGAPRPSAAFRPPVNADKKQVKICVSTNFSKFRAS